MFQDTGKYESLAPGLFEQRDAANERNTESVGEPAAVGAGHEEPIDALSAIQ